MNYCKQITSRLFYGKWPYKITVRLKGIAYFRENKSFDLPSDISTSKYLNYYVNTSAEFCKLTDFSKIFKKHLKKDLKLRFENHILDIYVKDNNLYDEILKDISSYVIRVHEPNNNIELNKLLENKKYILCDKLPYGKYQYRLFFKNMPSQIKINLITWAKKYNNNDIKINNKTESRFSLGKNYYGPCYCYVKDKNMLLLVSLAVQGNVGKTEEFILRESVIQA